MEHSCCWECLEDRTQRNPPIFFLFWVENSYLFPIFWPLSFCHLTPCSWGQLESSSFHKFLLFKYYHVIKFFLVTLFLLLLLEWSAEIIFIHNFIYFYLISCSLALFFSSNSQSRIWLFRQLIAGFCDR